MTTEDRMLFHLKPEFGERLLRNITREEMQSFLEVKARRYSRSVVGQIRLALNALDLRERLIFRMAVFDGSRPGEILSIRLGDIGPKEVHIKQRVYRGSLDTSKGRKGKGTERLVALSPGT